jgi:hypothetical protein
MRSGRLPTLLVAAAVGAAVLVALLTGSRWSAALLLPVVALLAWLTWAVWPRLRTGERVLRLLVLGLLTGWALTTLFAG